VPIITLYTNGTVVESNSELVYKLDPSSAGDACGIQSIFTIQEQFLGMRVWKKTSSGEVELTGGEPVAVADITYKKLQDNTVNFVYGYWEITSTIPLNPTDELLVRFYRNYGSGWARLWDELFEHVLAWRTVGLNAVAINPCTIAVRYAVFLSVSGDEEFLLAGYLTDYTRLENINITPAGLYKVAGYTRDQNNNPIPNCTVILFDALTDAKVASTVSDSSGYFEFTGLSSAGAYYIRAYKSGTPNLIGVTSRNVYGVPV